MLNDLLKDEPSDTSSMLRPDPLPLQYSTQNLESRSLDKSAALLAVLCSLISPKFGDGLLNGLGEGVGRDVFATSEGRGPSPLLTPPGEKRDGTVPARARLVCGRLSGVGRCEKSGKPSVGDSGIFSRRGVELPLVGGPHTLTGRPSWAWISRALPKNC